MDLRHCVASRGANPQLLPFLGEILQVFFAVANRVELLTMAEDFLPLFVQQAFSAIRRENDSMNEQTTDGDDYTVNLRIEKLLDDFEKLCRKGNATEIEAFVGSHQNENPQLLQELVRISQQYEIDLEKILRGQELDPHTIDATIGITGLPSRNSRYVILRPHARGGLGQVSIALDSELNRHVALKEILPTHADDQKRQERFLQEAEITGQLEHPGIVPVYGLGAYADGRPYYAMRFVEGESLKSAIEAFHRDAKNGGRLTVGERGVRFRHLLGSFIAVCQAMHYAHCRYVLHRDIKPENIMLGPYGETLVVDWGLAKPVNSQKSDSSEFEVASGSGSGSQPVRLKSRDSHGETLEGSAVGTPAYMSPEQAAGKLGSLGPSTDIYSLGATLYALLTGQAPFKQDDAFSLLQAVREGRFESPRQMQRHVPKALDAICMKAMAKAPGDRYSTARELAEDLERFLADEPVVAMPETTIQRVSRWTRRNRSVVGYAAASLLIVTVVSMIAAVSNNRLRKEAQRQEKIAIDERTKAIQLAAENESIANANLKLAESEKRRSEEATRLAEEKQKLADEMTRLANDERNQRVTAETLSEFLTGLFYAADPVGMNVDFFIPKANGERLTASDILDRGADKVKKDKSLAESPLAKAQILQAIGDVNRQLGRFKESEPLLTEALEIRQRELGDKHAVTAASLHALAHYYHERGDFDRAKPLYEKAVAIRETLSGVEGQKARAASLHNLAWMTAIDGDPSEAEKLFRNVLELKRAIYGDLHRETAFSRMGIAFSLIEQRRMLEVIPLAVSFKADFEKLEGTGDLVEGVTQFVTALANQRLISAAVAEPYFRSALDSISRGLTEDNGYTALVHCELAACLQKQNKLEEAEEHYRAALKVAREKVQMQHPRIGILVDRLSRLLADKGQSQEAAAIWEEFLAAQKFRFGEKHRYVVEATCDYADFLRYDERYDESTKMFRAFLENAAAANRAQGYRPHLILFLIGRNLLEKKPSDLAGAEAVLRESLASFAADAGDKREYIEDEAFGLIHLARAICRQGRLTEAEEAIKQAEKAALKMIDAEDKENFRDRLWETRILLQRQSRDAEALIMAHQDWIAEKSKRLGPTAPGVLTTQEELAKVHEAIGQFESAIKIRKETLAARESRLPAADRAVLAARERLGRTLLAAKQYQDAVPLLEAAYARRADAKDAGAAAALGNLFIAKDHLNQVEDANRHWADWLALIEKLHPSDETKLMSAKAAYARLLLDHGRYERALELLPGVVAHRVAREPEKWTTLSAQSMLGHAYLGLKKLAEAEPLLRDSWKGMEAQEKAISTEAPARIREALSRMIALEESLSRPEEAAKWKAMLDEREKNRLLELE